MPIKKIVLVIVFLLLIAATCAYGLYRNLYIFEKPQVFSFNVNIASQMIGEDYKLAQASNTINSIFMELKFVQAKYGNKNDENSQRIVSFANRMLGVYQNTLTSGKPEDVSKIFSNDDLIFLNNNEKILLHQANNFICFPKLENFFELKKESTIRKDALSAIMEDLRKKNINADIISFSYANLITPTKENKEFQAELEKILSCPDIIQNNEKLRQLGQIDEKNVKEVRKIFESTRNIFWKQIENLDFKWKHTYVLIAQDKEKIYAYKIYPYIQNNKIYWNIESQAISNQPVQPAVPIQPVFNQPVQPAASNQPAKPAAS